MKLTADRPFADPGKAARRLLEHAHAFEPIQDGRIYIEKINSPFLFNDKGTPAEYRAGLEITALAGAWYDALPSPSIHRPLQRVGPHACTGFSGGAVVQEFGRQV